MAKEVKKEVAIIERLNNLKEVFKASENQYAINEIDKVLEDFSEIETVDNTQEVEFEENSDCVEQGRLIEKDGVLFDTVLNKPHVPGNEIVRETFEVSGGPLKSFAIDKVDENTIFIRENYDEDDVHEVAAAKTPLFNIGEVNRQIEEKTWDSIWERWHTDFHGMNFLNFLDFLKEFYNPPTCK